MGSPFCHYLRPLPSSSTLDCSGDLPKVIEFRVLTPHTDSDRMQILLPNHLERVNAILPRPSWLWFYRRGTWFLLEQIRWFGHPSFRYQVSQHRFCPKKMPYRLWSQPRHDKLHLRQIWPSSVSPLKLWMSDDTSITYHLQLTQSLAFHCLSGFSNLSISFWPHLEDLASYQHHHRQTLLSSILPLVTRTCYSRMWPLTHR